MIKLDHFFDKKIFYSSWQWNSPNGDTPITRQIYISFIKQKKNQTLEPHFTNFNEFCSNVELCGRLQLSLDVFNEIKEVSELRM